MSRAGFAFDLNQAPTMRTRANAAPAQLWDRDIFAASCLPSGSGKAIVSAQGRTPEGAFATATRMLAK